MQQIPELPYLLYAEDDPDDQEILSEVMASIKPGFPVITLENGLKIMHFLQDIDPAGVLPCAIVLDINMPVKDGIKTLEEIKQSQRFRNIPVYILSNSANPRDRDTTLQLGAKAFFTKPTGRTELLKIGQEFIEPC